MDSLCRVRNKIMYELLWRTNYELTSVLFWCLFPSLLRNSGNKHQNNTLVSAKTVRHASTYIILYILGTGNDGVLTSLDCCSSVLGSWLVNRTSSLSEVLSSMQVMNISIHANTDLSKSFNFSLGNMSSVSDYLCFFNCTKYVQNSWNFIIHPVVYPIPLSHRHIRSHQFIELC